MLLQRRLTWALAQDETRREPLAAEAEPLQAVGLTLRSLLSTAGGKPVAFGKHRVGEWNNGGEGAAGAGAAAFPALPGRSISRFSPSFSLQFFIIFFFLYLFFPHLSAANLHPETQRPPSSAILSAEGPL